MLEEFLGARDALDRCELAFGLGVVDLRKTVDLLDVEHCVALEERDFALDILTVVVVVLGARDGIGVDHERALLAFADMRVQFECLLKGHPDRRRKTLLHRAGPEHQDIDAGIGLAIMAKRAREVVTKLTAGGRRRKTGNLPERILCSSIRGFGALFRQAWSAFVKLAAPSTLVMRFRL